MENKDAFGGCHPAVNFAYFVLVTGCGMFFMHPVCLAVSLLGAVSCYIRLRGARSARFFLKRALPVMLLAAATNSLFNHRGDTVLCLLPTGNKLTLESVLYGAAAAVMLVSVLTWFGCYTEIMTSDKFMYLFGRIIPSLSLVLSMTLRFVPRFKERFGQVREARICMGKTARSPMGKLKNALSCFSVMTSWSLESSIETADSMKSRGYGLRGRTSFSIFAFTERDMCILAWLVLSAMFMISGAVSGNLSWQYYPGFGGELDNPLAIALEAVYFMVCFTPIAIDVWEGLQWRSSRSKI